MASSACPSHLIPSGEEWRFILALLVDTKLVAIKPRLFLLLFNVQIDFHWLFSSGSAWLINAPTKWHCQRLCGVAGQGSSVV